jgi:hypothetical protein
LVPCVPAGRQAAARGTPRRLRDNDRAIVVASPDAADAVVKGADISKVAVAPDLASVRACFDVFQGAVFIKGSRRYQLETLLQPSGQTAPSAH